MGQDTMKIPYSMHDKLRKRLVTKLAEEGTQSGWVFLQGKTGWVFLQDMARICSVHHNSPSHRYSHGFNIVAEVKHPQPWT